MRKHETVDQISWFMDRKYLRGCFQGKHVRQHRVIWELIYGPIPDGHCVHHIDGNKTHNCISNLELMKHGEHSSHHQKGLIKRKLCKHGHDDWVFTKKGRRYCRSCQQKNNIIYNNRRKACKLEAQ